jgi:hypothetical protein
MCKEKEEETRQQGRRKTTDKGALFTWELRMIGGLPLGRVRLHEISRRLRHAQAVVNQPPNDGFGSPLAAGLKGKRRVSRPLGVLGCSTELPS